MHNERRVYQLKTNKEADDYSDLAHFINVLNNTPNDELVCKLEEVFNVYDYLKVIASDILMGNWDGPIYNKNNFYLYHNTTSGKIEYIPYDLDNTYGIDWYGIDWGKRNIYNWSRNGEARPIYTKIMENDELRNQYSYYINKLITSTINLDSLNDALINRRGMLFPYIVKDNYYSLDYGFTPSDFMNSIWTAYGKHVKYGISEYLAERKSTILVQVEKKQMQPVIKYIKHQKISGSEVQILAFVEVKNQPAGVSVEYSNDGSIWKTVTMFDDGNHNDGKAGDLIYGALITGLDSENETVYQIFAEDANNNNKLMPCEPIVIPANANTPLLFINEFMASNNSTIADEQGNYSDWIEIYNGSEEGIWLGDKYLSDNLGSPSKWQMPEFTLGSQMFVLFWADGNPANGDFHTNFKLSKNGEEIGIFTEDHANIDEITFGAQTTDISYGRQQDGNIPWVFFDTPTPGASNSPDAINEEQLATKEFILYPNPTNGGIVKLSKSISFKVYDIYGRLIEQTENYDIINTASYNKGIYIIVSEKGSKQKLIVN